MAVEHALLPRPMCARAASAPTPRRSASVYQALVAQRSRALLIKVKATKEINKAKVVAIKATVQPVVLANALVVVLVNVLAVAPASGRAQAPHVRSLLCR